MQTRVHRRRLSSLQTAVAALFTPVVALAQSAAVGSTPLPAAFAWATVANSAVEIPGGGGRTFNSFNQPSVNSSGTVVMRARSSGAQGAGEPVRGIYARRMANPGAPLTVVFDTKTPVPQPNNVLYSGAPGTFTEFPAFPRMGIDNETIATRAQSKPVYEYQTGTDPVTGEPVTTRVGTSGLYLTGMIRATSGMTQLGSVPGYGHFSVPGATPGTKFDQFPGAPAVASLNTVAFKGNFTDGTSKTGIFFRTFDGPRVPGKTQVLASSDKLIPGQPAGGTRFGSTSPPSAVGTNVVFLGLDNEEAPTLGGIYRAQIGARSLQTLVSIGGQVPGEPGGIGFNKLGEALSFDGRFIAFWGAWGDAVRSITLTCPVDGQTALIAFCNQNYPTGFTVDIPLNQGFFVHDLATGQSHPVAKTGGEYVDFLYWVFSGRPPGAGESEAEDPEPPRWRSASFVAAHGSNGKAQVAFKARKPTVPMVDGLYLTLAPALPAVVRTLAETTTAATLIDPAAPAGARVTALGIERDGLRNGWLAISASMLDPVTSESWAGVYVTRTEN